MLGYRLHHFEGYGGVEFADLPNAGVLCAKAVTSVEPSQGGLAVTARCPPRASSAQVGIRMFSDDVYKFGLLAAALTRDLPACAATCDDISTNQAQVVRASFVVVP